jgi:hypothetical protein
MITEKTLLELQLANLLVENTSCCGEEADKVIPMIFSLLDSNKHELQVIRQSEMVINIVEILEDVKATYSGDRYIKERLNTAIMYLNVSRPIDIIKKSLDEFNDAMIDILPEDFDGKKVNAVYDKVLKALSV